MLASMIKQTSYHSKKTRVIQKLMCPCSSHITLTFVYKEWEGTANHARAFLGLITREVVRFPMPAQGV